MSASNYALNVRRGIALSTVVLTVVAILCYINRPEAIREREAEKQLIEKAAPPSGPSSQLLASATATDGDSAQPASVNWRRSMTDNLARLKQGLKTIENVPHYKARFYKQEMVHAEMTEPQLIDLRLRHEPFSIYMKWLAGYRGQEILYVDGQLEGDMLVKLSGWKSRLIPALKIDPTGDKALSRARYPVTEAGLAAIARMLIADRESDLQKSSGITCRVFANERCNERNCVCYVIQYERPGICREYRKSVQYIDHELNLPICVRNFTWPEDDSPESGLNGEELDEATMIELYSYSDIELDCELDEMEFNRKNENYRFNHR